MASRREEHKMMVIVDQRHKRFSRSPYLARKKKFHQKRVLAPKRVHNSRYKAWYKIYKQQGWKMR